MRPLLILLLGAGSLVAQNTCSASGTVVDRVTRQPVPRAKLTVQAPRSSLSGTADNSGNWTFSGLPCARVAISATRFGYLDSRQTRAISQATQLEPGSPARVQIELTPQAVISGKVSDQNGDPVMGVRVVPYIARAEDGRRVMRNAPQTVTDDRGEFRIPELESGRYIVCAQPALGRQDYGDQCYPADLATGARAAMPVRPGSETNVDFSLSTVRRVRVSGTVNGAPDGSPVNIQFARQPSAVFEPRLRAAVLPNGSFALPDVPSGSYMLVATARRDGREFSARMPIEIGNAAIENLSLSLLPDADLHGTVEMESQSSETSNPPRMEIALVSPDADFRPGQLVWSDDRRSFTLTGVSPGTYRLKVTGTGFYVKTATMDGRDISSGEFAIGQTSGPLQIVLSTNTGSLEGDVTAGDAPAPAWVVLLRGGASFRIFPVENGHFSVRNLPPGAYTAYAWDDVGTVEYANPEWMRQNAAPGVAFTIEAGGNATVKLVRQTAPSE